MPLVAVTLGDGNDLGADEGCAGKCSEVEVAVGDVTAVWEAGELGERGSDIDCEAKVALTWSCCLSAFFFFFPFFSLFIARLRSSSSFFFSLLASFFCCRDCSRSFALRGDTGSLGPSAGDEEEAGGRHMFGAAGVGGRDGKLPDAGEEKLVGRGTGIGRGAFCS